MLEILMEEAIAGCPDLFIEPGLTLVRRQVVINGRRPDVLFSDGLSRHLLVEIQSGRLDEDHLQRHFYYYFDYRSKYPSTHPRLMFIANRIVIRHKDFLDEHGYEYKEILESEFERKANACLGRREEPEREQVEVVTSPGVLDHSRMSYCTKSKSNQWHIPTKCFSLRLWRKRLTSPGAFRLGG